ncbi:MaoC family dehydratase N-terminal domain-containing protein [Myxococcota bacterium]|nr:MaoC family dehydratase N-terminal domain-containing protein [Myxococcota bacterium]
MAESLAGTFPRITERGLDQLRERVGVKIEDSLEPWCYEATRDAIRHYAHGVGDDNPLWCDPEYAQSSIHGGLVALPSFVFPSDRIISGYVGGLPGIHAMWAGANFHWHHWIKRNDEIKTEAWLKELIPHETRFSGKAIQQVYHVDFYNQDDVLICEADSWCFRTERDTAREEGTKYREVKEREPRVYTSDELGEFFELYANEKIRGDETRFFEDVTEGELLSSMAKGPMTVTGFIAYVQGWGGLYVRSNKLAWQQIRKHSGLGIPNRFGIPDCPERVHWEEEFALTVGAPGAYDYGPERCSWLIHHLTNWMGDDGFLVKSHCKIRRHNPVGDLLTIDGRVTRKFEENGEGFVEIEQEAHNQDGELSVIGGGVVKLPTKNS